MGAGEQVRLPRSSRCVAAIRARTRKAMGQYRKIRRSCSRNSHMRSAITEGLEPAIVSGTVVPNAFFPAAEDLPGAAYG